MFSSFDIVTCWILQNVQNKWPVFHLHAGLKEFQEYPDVNYNFPECMILTEAARMIAVLSIKAMVLSKDDLKMNSELV